MNIRKRRSDRSGRVPLFSPGRPPVAGREERRRFWAAIAAGTASEDAAVGAGVPQAVGTRWFRKAGGMPPSMFGLSAKPLSGRYLSFAEREEIALLRVQGYSMQEVARRLGRVASTISRERGATPPPSTRGPERRLIGRHPQRLLTSFSYQPTKIVLRRPLESALALYEFGPSSDLRSDPKSARMDKTACWEQLTGDAGTRSKHRGKNRNRVGARG